jgi:hypothetical protein
MIKSHATEQIWFFYFEEALGQANADGQDWGVAMA